MDGRASRAPIATFSGNSSSSEYDAPHRIAGIEAVAAGVQKHPCKCSRNFENNILTNEKQRKPPTIKLKILNQSLQWVVFRIPVTTSFDELKMAYADRVGLQPASIRFCSAEGERLTDQTPLDMEMEDGDQIDALVEFSGGNSVAASTSPILR